LKNEEEMGRAPASNWRSLSFQPISWTLTEFSDRIRFRRWWQPPHPASNGPEERRITFLELFYDLVYVVIIAELSHGFWWEPSLWRLPVLRRS